MIFNELVLYFRHGFRHEGMGEMTQSNFQKMFVCLILFSCFLCSLGGRLRGIAKKAFIVMVLCLGFLSYAHADDSSVYISQNEAPFNGIGLITYKSGPFSLHMWRNVSHADMFSLLSHVQGYTHSGIVNQGVLSVLRSSAVIPPYAPSDEDQSHASFFYERLNALWKLGDISDLVRFYHLVDGHNLSPHTRQLFIKAQILAGNDIEPCKVLAQGYVNVKSAFWQKISVACSAFAGKVDGVNMGLSILQNMNEDVDGLAKIARLAVKGKPIHLSYPENLTIFDYYALRAGKTAPKGLDKVRDPLLLKSILLWDKVPVGERLVIGEKLWDKGLLDAETWRRFLEEVNEETSPRGNSVFAKEVRSYIAFERAVQKGDVDAQEKAVVNALRTTKKTRDFILVARIYHVFLQHLVPDIDLKDHFMPIMAALIFVADDTQNMRQLASWVQFVKLHFPPKDQVKFWPFMSVLQMQDPKMEEAWVHAYLDKKNQDKSLLLRLFSPHAHVDIVDFLSNVHEGGDLRAQENAFIPLIIHGALREQSALMVMSAYYIMGDQAWDRIPQYSFFSIVSSFGGYPVYQDKLIFEWLLSKHIMPV